jgi:hypothetical protein
MGPRERERERLRESSNDRDFAEYSKSCGVLADSIVPSSSSSSSSSAEYVKSCDAKSLRTVVGDSVM